MNAFDPALWRRLDAALGALLDLHGQARADVLSRIVKDDPELGPHLAALLQADACVDGPIDAPLSALADRLGAADDVDCGTRTLPMVPRYRILREIGRGGMGTVYLAERDDGQFEQTAALKVLNAGADAAGITQRFLLERSILARLEHPGIARLLDGGVTADGRPYFVMEYVEGSNITDFADAEQLDVRERIDLFIEVCAAVAHAQRHLVVHRDLKPSNILVADGRRVKLLDFGIAKLLDDLDGGTADVTLTGSRPLTPAYAAPEQLRGDMVTTATDVYALGAVLYELLCGRSPHPRTGAAPGLFEMAVLTQDPDPLDRFAADSEADRIAHARRVSGPVLRRQLRGELSRIVTMAMRKEPERRYASAAELRDDLENYVNGRPVVAQGDSATYRARKFMRRNRLAVVATTLVMVAMAAGLIGTAWQAREASRQAARAGQITEFLTGLFAGADPDDALGPAVSAADLLDRGAGRLDSELGGEPEVQAELLQLVGVLQVKLGRYEEGRPLLERAVDLHASLFGVRDRRTGAAMADLGAAMVHTGNYAAAESLLTRAVELERSAGGSPRSALARQLNDLGVVRARLDDPAGALIRYCEALAVDRQVFGRDHPDVAVDLDNIAVVLASMDSLDAAMALHREALDIRRRRFTGDHSTIGTSLHNLAFTTYRSGEIATADSLYREAIAMRRRLYPAGHPYLAGSLKNLAEIERVRGRLGAADSLLTEAMEIARGLLGPDHEEVAGLLNEQGMVAFGRRDYRACEDRFAASLAIWERYLPAGHPKLLSVAGNLAFALRANGKYREAERRYREILAARRERMGAAHPLVALDLVSLGVVLRLDRRSAEAAVELEQGLAIRLARPEVAPLELAHSRFHLGAALGEAGRHGEAESFLRSALETYEQHLPADAPRRAEARCALGSCLLAQGRTPEAAEELAAGLRALGSRLEDRDPVAAAAARDFASLAPTAR